MLRTLAVVQARMGSRRLQGKISRPLGGHSLLERVVRRVTDCEHIDQVIVAAGNSSADRAIRDLVPSDVPVYFGSESDVLSRFAEVIDAYEPTGVVRVCADNPFIDPELIDPLVVTAAQHPECDYLSYARRNGRPAILTAVGLFAEWCRAEALLIAHREATALSDREHVTRFLYSQPDRFRLRLLPMPERLDREDLRLTVDFEEDFDHAETIFEALGPERLDWRRIADLLEMQPDLRERMARLNQQHAKS